MITSKCSICKQPIIDDGYGWKHDGYLNANHKPYPVGRCINGDNVPAKDGRVKP